VLTDCVGNTFLAVVNFGTGLTRSPETTVAAAVLATQEGYALGICVTRRGEIAIIGLLAHFSIAEGSVVGIASA